ncbi:MAG TPA: acetylornithine deacetylase, partial [Chloroflexota bacterium]|nr:acetylornithine deacetylase [Chloroflexota bacterium]
MDPAIDEGPIIELLRSLVAVPSVNPGIAADGEGEGAVGDLVAEWGRAEGFDITLQEIQPGRRNVVLDLGLTGAPTLALVTHLDTVPHGDLTGRARAVAVECGRVYGRG